MRAFLLSLAALGALAGPVTAQPEGPSYAAREAALKSLVHIAADDCADGAPRAGSGFAYEQPGRVVTAHHVVGGCQRLTVTYEGVPHGAARQRAAQVARVLAVGDLALLEVPGAPSVSVLRLGRPPVDKAKAYAGFGYQNGQLTAGDQLVTFSTGQSRLVDILPPEAQQELARAGSRIDTRRQVLRFNVALQPGMSGGPIIDGQGQVVGIVAGGLKAGAAPASWGWPAEWVGDLMASNDAREQPVRVAGTYYSLPDMQAVARAEASGRRIRCGQLDFEFRGRRSFADVARGADDHPRLQYLLQIAAQPPAAIDALAFDIWTHQSSGATAVVPSGYPMETQGNVCVVRSGSGPFTQVVWAAPAHTQLQIAQVSTLFEQQVMYPLAPYNFGFQFDPALTTQGPQLRDNGMVFNRKGFTQPKSFWSPGMPAPAFAHTFETLIAKAGTFLGVGTLNNDMPPPELQRFCLQGGQMPVCAVVLRNLAEWTHFILATQLSTYPAT
jgi:hypothetical protein